MHRDLPTLQCTLASRIVRRRVHGTASTDRMQDHSSRSVAAGKPPALHAWTLHPLLSQALGIQCRREAGRHEAGEPAR